MEKWSLEDTQDFICQWIDYGDRLNSLYNNKRLNLSSAKDQAKCKYINNCLLEEIAEYMDAKIEHRNHRLDELADVCNFLSWLRFATGVNPERIITQIEDIKYQSNYSPINSYTIIGSFTMYGLMQMNLLHNREWVEDETPLDERRFLSGIIQYITDIIYFISCQEFKVNEVLEAIERKYQVNYKRIKNNY